MADWLTLAERALRKEGKPLHVNEMAVIVASLEKTTLTNEEVSAKLSSSLAQAVKKKDTIFAKIKNKNGSLKKGIYKLKQTRTKKDTTIIDMIKNEEVSTSKMSTQFVGKGGEFAVLSELLFREFNASIMTVDDGVDIIASKNNKYFHIQVKTSIQKTKNDSLSFSIKNSSFSSAYSGQTFYVLVFRREYKGMGYKNDFVILPNSTIDHFITDGTITSSTSISIKISIDDKGNFYLNKTQINQYVNDFSRLK